jgi:hypothetical protein
MEILNCTFVSMVGEDYFNLDAHKRYGACALDGDASAIFGRHTAHLLHLPEENQVHGDVLSLAVRESSSSRRRRRLERLRGPQSAQFPDVDLREFDVLSVLSVQHARRRLDAVTGPSVGPTTRTVLTICMQYARSTAQCDEAVHGSPVWRAMAAIHDRVSYGRLSPAWDLSASRFITVPMDANSIYAGYSGPFREQDRYAHEHSPPAPISYAPISWCVRCDRPRPSPPRTCAASM